MDITSDHSNNSWKFHDDTMMGTWWKRCDGRTDRRTDRRTDGLNQSYSCLVAAKNINETSFSNNLDFKYGYKWKKNTYMYIFIQHVRLSDINAIALKLSEIQITKFVQDLDFVDRMYCFSFELIHQYHIIVP